MGKLKEWTVLVFLESLMLWIVTTLWSLIATTFKCTSYSFLLFFVHPNFGTQHFLFLSPTSHLLIPLFSRASLLLFLVSIHPWAFSTAFHVPYDFLTMVWNSASFTVVPPPSLCCPRSPKSISSDENPVAVWIEWLYAATPPPLPHWGPNFLPCDTFSNDRWPYYLTT